jgi:hypothetical protein
MYNFEFCKPARLLLIYGLFAALCHASAVLFLARGELGAPPDLLFHLIFPLLEHSLMSFVLVLLGALAIEYISGNASDF